MIHHGCVHATGASVLNRLANDRRTMTLAVMGYDGRYRCAECKRRVKMDVSDETYAKGLQRLPNAEPPYPDGWCDPDRAGGEAQCQ